MGRLPLMAVVKLGIITRSSRTIDFGLAVLMKGGEGNPIVTSESHSSYEADGFFSERPMYDLREQREAGIIGNGVQVTVPTSRNHLSSIRA